MIAVGLFVGHHSRLICPNSGEAGQGRAGHSRDTLDMPIQHLSQHPYLEAKPVRILRDRELGQPLSQAGVPRMGALKG